MHLPCLRRLAGVLSILCLTFGAVRGAAAQDAYTIQGVVLNAATREPIPNVSVVIRDTEVGTLTDPGGRYTLTANLQPGTYTLQYTLLGRGDALETLTLGAESEIEIPPVLLKETAVELEGIVVTGTGVSSERKALGNTVASVAGQAVSEAPGATTIDEALQGKVTGAVISQNSGAPGGGVSIRLRGTSSILGGAEPLIVVDGVIIDNNSDALISVGANAGRQGAAPSNRLADIAPGDIARIEILKGAAAAALYGSRANNGVIQIFTKSGEQGEPTITFRTEASTSAAPNRYDLLMAPVAGRGDVLFGGAPELGAPVQRFDLQDEVFHRAYGTSSYLSIAGGSEGTTYFMSGSWQNDQGIVRPTDYNNISARARVGQRLSDQLNVSVNANFIQSETNYVPEGEQTEGVLTTIIFTPTIFDPAFDPELGRFPYSPILGTNPLDVIENWRTELGIDRFIGNVQADWRPLEDLDFTFLFGVDNLTQEAANFQPPFSTDPDFSGLVQNPVRQTERYNTDITGNYRLELNPDVEISTTAGFRYTSDYTNEIRATARDLPPGQETVGGATQLTGQTITELATVGGFLQERLDVADRLFLTGGVNVEASSAFGEEERWQLFPRLGASYVVSNEPVWTDRGLDRYLSTLRLRAAYGQTGGQPPGAYLRFESFGDVAFAGRPGLIPSSVAGNPNLKPERQREYEFGFDAGFFDDRAQLEFTYYDQLTYDLVLGVPLAPTTGFDVQFQNIGELTNRGVEISLNTVNITRPGFTWRTRASYAANRNEITELVTGADTTTVGYLNAVIEGQPIGVFFGGFYERDAAGNIVVVDGIPQRARDPRTGRFAKKIIGDPNPDFTAALSNSFTLGDDLEISVLLDGRFGNDVANFTRRITEFFGTAAVVEREITGEVPVGFYVLNGPRIGNYEEYIEDGSFIKLREIGLSYTLRDAWARRVGANGITLRVAGRNLYTWTDYSGLDPEINLFSASTVARGVDFAVTPIPRTFVVGATFSF